MVSQEVDQEVGVDPGLPVPAQVEVTVQCQRKGNTIVLQESSKRVDTLLTNTIIKTYTNLERGNKDLIALAILCPCPQSIKLVIKSITKRRRKWTSITPQKGILEKTGMDIICRQAEIDMKSMINMRNTTSMKNMINMKSTDGDDCLLVVDLEKI